MAYEDNMLAPQYIHFKPNAAIKELFVEPPFAAVVTIDANVTHEWRAKVSDWLVEKGCLYMLAHGHECSLWDDSVDFANLEAYNWDVPEGKSIMTTWHEDESLQEVLYFAISSVPYYPLIKHMVVLDVSDTPREFKILKTYRLAENELEEDRQNDVVENEVSPDASDVSLLRAFLGLLCSLVGGLVILFLLFRFF